MKILQLSNSDLSGGAAVATYRLHKALLNSSINSKMLVNEKKTTEITVINKSSSLDNIKTIIKNLNLLKITRLV